MAIGVSSRLNGIALNGSFVEASIERPSASWCRQDRC